MPLDLVFTQPGTFTIDDNGIPGDNTSVIRDGNGVVIFTFVHPADALGLTVNTPGVNIIVNLTDSLGAANFSIGNLTNPAITPDSVVMSNIDTTGTVTLASNGTITEGGADAASDITAGALIMSAVGGVGTGGNAIETRTGLFEAETTTGGINIRNIGSVQIGGVTADVDGLDVVTSGNINFTTIGSIFLTEANSVTAAEVVHGGSTSGNVTLIASGANADIIGNVDNAVVSVPRGTLTMTAGRDIQLGTIGANFNNDVTTNDTLTFNAGRDILIDGFADVLADNFGQNTGGDLIFNAGRNIGILNVAGTSASVTASGSGGGNALITTGAGGALTVNGPGNFALGSTSGDVIVSADRVLIDTGSGISAPSGQVTIRPVTEGRDMILGSASDASLAVELSDAELDRVFANSLVIGSTEAGLVRIIAPVSPSGTPDLTIFSGTNISIESSFSAIDAITLRAGDDILQAGATFITAGGIFNAFVDNAQDDVSTGGSGIFAGAITSSSIRINGNLDADTLEGTAGNDILRGLAGNDTLQGEDGNDDLFGGTGADALDGGADFDFARYDEALAGVVASLASGGSGGEAAGDSYSAIEALIGSDFADSLTGDGADNFLAGHAGNDILVGAAGNDDLFGGAGADALDGGADFDSARYDDAAAGVVASLASGGSGGEAAGDSYSAIEALIGSNFADSLTGDGNGNVVAGHAGNDILRGLAGIDTLQGGAGNDDLFGGLGADALDGGADMDFARYDDAAAGVVASLASGGAGGEAAGDTYSAIEGLIGSNFADNLTGDGNANFLGGGAGNDILRGLAGIDTLVGAAGNDDLFGGTGADALNGGADFDFARYDEALAGVIASLASGGSGGEAAGDSYSAIEALIGSAFADSLTGDGNGNFLGGGSGNDILRGLAGIDTLVGAAGIDDLIGGLGADALNGGADFDFARYDDAAAGVVASLTSGGSGGEAAGDSYSAIEALIGSNFADSLTGDGAGNFLAGRTGNDILRGLAGIDTLQGEAGNDDLFGGIGADALDGGADFDSARYDDAAAGVVASLTSGGSGGEAAGDSYSAIEALIGSNFADSLTGDGAGNVLAGGGGNDILRGLAGNDALQGAAGNDDLFGGTGADALNGGADFDSARYDEALAGVTASLASGGSGGEAAGDTYSAIEALIGSAFADNLTGDGADNVLAGGGGNDILRGLAGNDALQGAAGIDHLFGGLGADALNGGADFDIARYDDAAAGVVASLASGGSGGEAAGDSYSAIEALIGSNFADSLTGDGAGNFLAGGGGNDILRGLAGIDTVQGEAGNDDLFGGVGADALDGGADFDFARYDDAAAGVVASLASGGSGGEAAGDTYSTIEALIGSNFADSLTGDGVGNFLAGHAGNDVLDGLAGNDTLLGEGGNDQFVFDTALNAATNVDQMPDFNVADDTIVLDNAIFTTIVGIGTLSAVQFAANASGTAQDADDRIVYETDTGNLFFDSNGNTAGGSTLFAQLDAGLALTNNDFLII